MNILITKPKSVLVKTIFGYTTGQLTAQYLRAHKQVDEARRLAAWLDAEIKTFERLPVEVFEDVKRRAQPFLTEAR